MRVWLRSLTSCLGLAGALWLAPCTAVHADELVSIATRPNVKLSFWHMPRPNAVATVILLTGGAGGLGYKNGQVTSQNFLIRSRDLFAAQGFNVIAPGIPSDQRELDYDFRASAEHAEDLQSVVTWAQQQSAAPVWVIGTSRGTISATNLAIAQQKQQQKAPSTAPRQGLAGIVLTASVTAYSKAGAVPTQDLASLRLPVLVVHHRQDACKICAPHEVPLIMRGLKNVAVKKLLWIDAGSNPQGDPCEALHWHGFIGAEADTVQQIADWVKAPSP